jgi:hypothetical protein
MSLTPAMLAFFLGYCWPVSTTPAKQVKNRVVTLAGVVDDNDTGKTYFAGVIDTGKTCATGVVDTSEAPKLLNIFTKILKSSKSFLGMPIGARGSCLTKKTGGEKSRGTVPLISKMIKTEKFHVRAPLSWTS